MGATIRGCWREKYLSSVRVAIVDATQDLRIQTFIPSVDRQLLAKTDFSVARVSTVTGIFMEAA
jgi:hypothetical protein